MSASSTVLTTVPIASTLPALPKRRREDNDFLAPALEVLETPPSPIRMAMILCIGSLAVAAISWAYFGRIDIVAKAQGKIQPVGRVKLVQPIENGKVVNILATNGSRVKKGDLLIQLDPAEVQAEVGAAELGLASARAECLRRTAAIMAAEGGRFDTIPIIPWPNEYSTELHHREDRVLGADFSQLAANIASLDAQKAQKDAERDQLMKTTWTQEQLIATLRQRVDMRSELIRVNAGTKSALIDATETLQYQLTQLEMQRGQLAAAQTGSLVIAKQIDKARDDFISDNAQKLGESERKVEGLQQDLARARAKLDQMSLRAPVAGVVQASTVTNSGQVLASGQEVMRIVPEDTVLEAEVYVLNRDIGFIRAGEDAVVKVEAFPFTHYGVIDAKVSHVASDAIPEPDAAQAEADSARPSVNAGFAGAQRTQNLVFPVRLKLNASSINADGQDAPLTSGMTVSVDFKTGRRTILEYLFSPIVEIGSSAMRER